MNEYEIGTEIRMIAQSGDEDLAIRRFHEQPLTFLLHQQVALAAMIASANNLLRSVIERDPSMLMRFDHEPTRTTRAKNLLSFALGAGNLKAVKLLVQHGADFNVPNICSPSPIYGRAAESGNLELVRWLLDKGAKVNYTANGCTCCYMMFGAAYNGNLEMVKLLVERGGLFNATNAYGANALSYAKAGGSQEVIDYLRSVGAKYPWELRGEPEPMPAPESPPMSEVERSLSYHFSNNFGAWLNPISREVLRPDWPIEIHLLDCRVDYGEGDTYFWVLATHGMSAEPMSISPGADLPEHDEDRGEYRFAELFMRLPRECDEVWLKRPANRWIVEWLFTIARWPHENGAWLGPSAVFANGDPPAPLAPDVPMTCLLVTPTEEDFSRWYASEQKLVRYYWVYPIFTEERDFERQHGTKALLEKLAAAGCPLFISPDRVNVCASSE